MRKNSDNMDYAAAAKLAQTPAGQKLMEMLSHSDPQALQLAAQHANQGDLGMAMKQLEQVLRDPDFKSLLSSLNMP